MNLDQNKLFAIDQSVWQQISSDEQQQFLALASKVGLVQEPYKAEPAWKELQKKEPILRENPQRFVIFPIKHHDVWAEYKKHFASFWTVEELDLSQDYKDWVTLSSDERHFISMVLAFFAASDGIVNENISTNFVTEVQIPEARHFYAFQEAMENVHSETYSLLIDTYIKDTDEKARLFNAASTIPAVAAKAAFSLKWMTADCSFATRLVAYACVEGILFSGSFCAIFWLKKKGKMPGLTFSNELIARDEGLHTKFACQLYSMLEFTKLNGEEVYNIVDEAVEVERQFICEALPVSLLGMNSKEMYEYIQYVADYVIQMLGFEKKYHVGNPFPWMETISLTGKTNFFEKRVSDYSKAGVGNTNTGSASANQDSGFSLDVDF